MTELYDEKRVEALLTTAPIQPLHTGTTVHRLITPGGRRAARCGDPEGILCSADWRLVSCGECRADKPGEWYASIDAAPPRWLTDSEASA